MIVCKECWFLNTFTGGVEEGFVLQKDFESDGSNFVTVFPYSYRGHINFLEKDKLLFEKPDEKEVLKHKLSVLNLEIRDIDNDIGRIRCDIASNESLLKSKEESKKEYMNEKQKILKRIEDLVENESKKGDAE